MVPQQVLLYQSDLSRLITLQTLTSIPQLALLVSHHIFAFTSCSIVVCEPPFSCEASRLISESQRIRRLTNFCAGIDWRGGPLLDVQNDFGSHVAEWTLSEPKLLVQGNTPAWWKIFTYCVHRREIPCLVFLSNNLCTILITYYLLLDRRLEDYNIVKL